MTTTMPDPAREVTLGADTHKDQHVAATLGAGGEVFATAPFPATGAGYQQTLEWASQWGTVTRAGVEGTGSWGAGLARHLQAAGVEVIEVNRPNRQHRRRHGKSDPADAVAAARAVQAHDATGHPRGHDGPIEALRMLRLARRSADQARTQAANQLHAVVDTAPDPLRDKFRGLPIPALAAQAARLRPRGDLTNPHTATVVVLAALARRWQFLTKQRAELDAHMAALLAQTAPPQLLAEQGVATHTAAALLIAAGDHPHRLHTEAAFAALCGVSPIDASSGKQRRHRLNRGGDRQANNALWRIVLVRLRWDPATRAYMARRTQQGKTKPEIIRCLKRYIARRIWRILTTHHHPNPNP